MDTLLTTPQHRVATLLDALDAPSFSGEGRVVGLIEKPVPGEHAVREVVTVLPGQGFAGDHPRKDYWRGERIPGREVTAISREVMQVLGIDPLVPGDNLVVEGIDLRALQPGDRLVIGAVVLERAEKPHRPCQLFQERTSPEAYAVALQGWRGALFRVRQGGTVRTGERVQVLAHTVR